ncbi:MAG: DUF362 domain-containing protein, partial [Euryarchaeota archaeon]
SSAHPERVYVSDISPKNLSQEIRKGLQFVRFEEIFDADSTVFIKPNLTDSVHKFGITTTPLMIQTIIEVVSPLVKRILVGESDGGNYAFSADVSLRNHGIYDVAQHFSNVEVVNLSKLSRTRVAQHVCGKTVWVELPDLLLNDIDCLISVPVFKTHAMTVGTFSIKNLWGCNPDPMRLLYHKNLDYKLALINKAVKNKVQVIDGFWSLDGHGPMEGTPVATNKVLIANNPVAADAVAAYLMNLEATKIGHIRVAEQFGLGTADLNRIHFNTPVQEERFCEFKPYKITLDYFQALLFRSEVLSKTVFTSPLTPFIYRSLNLFRPKEKQTFWAAYNQSINEATELES